MTTLPSTSALGLIGGIKLPIDQCRVIATSVVALLRREPPEPHGSFGKQEPPKALSVVSLASLAAANTAQVAGRSRLAPLSTGPALAWLNSP
jgi:hypothetical protein